MKNSAKKKILIVEDELPLLSSLEEKFESEGFIVITASDGEEGYQKVKAEKPDLVLIDIILPKLDGISMAKKIADLKMGILMIFLTNVNDMEHISEAISADITDYLVKTNYNINEIVERVKQKLGIK